MVQKVEITVFEGTEEIWTGISRTPLEIGRQKEGDSGPMELQDLVSSQRLVIAPVSARAIPREALKVECDLDGTIQITNIHPRLPFYIGNPGAPLGPSETLESRDEVIVRLQENRMLRIYAASPESIESPVSGADLHFRTLSGQVESTMDNVVPVKVKELFGGETTKDQGRAAVELVRSALTVVQKAAGSSEFYDSAVKAVANMADLDRAMILLREGNEWVVRSCFVSGQETSGIEDSINTRGFSKRLTERVLMTKETVIYDPANYMHTADSSMMALDRAVAAPIFDDKRNVIGAIYGDRKFASETVDTPIGELEATLLQVMAGAVSSGIARQRQEAIRSSLTQFFSQEIAERLEKNDDLLAGRDAEVTVMFCDIRGFSTVSERVGPAKTIEWINDVLTELSLCVTKTDGVLVDYVGDELMAMWGAPAEMPDHAARACRSACEMLGLTETLRERWKEITPDRFGFGIGINTGVARVGNTGSKVKFKYGPLGNTVNVASRVEGITKKLGVTALITNTTADAIGKEFDFRRMSQVQVVGIQEPVTLYELKASAKDEWRSMAERYEEALSKFENGDLTGAARALASLVHNYADDNPSLVLLGRVVDALTKREEKAGAVWIMDSK